MADEPKSTHEVVYGQFPCAEPGCNRVCGPFVAFRRDVEDRRVWCVDHAYRAYQEGVKPV